MATSSLAIGTSASNLVDVPVEPNTYDWGLQDISSSDAGRVQNANNKMYKNRISQKRMLSVSWENPTLKDASTILQMVNPEYVYIRYLDILDGKFKVREFYTGDKKAPFRSIALVDPDGNRSVVTTLSFNFIER